uniref:Major facilitator superfamily (MFS) profile domain-containing protein n=1 Tax=Glossina brevipalpis TaxID=37001 RepID=A0A1A9WSP4_9MUSC
MSSTTSSESNHKMAGTSNQESSHLLENAVRAEIYGSQPAEQQNLLNKMVHTTGVENLKTFPQYVAALSAAGGAFAAGTLLGWTSPAQNRLTGGEYGFPVSEAAFSWIGSAMTLGAAFICIPIGFLMNLIGRKLTMLFLVLPFTLGWALLIWAQNVEMMYAARFILGISGGAFCVTAPMYTGEIAHKDIRGTLGSFFQLMITAGILFIYAIGAGLDVYAMSLVCDYNYNPELEELKATEEQIKQQSVSMGAALLRPVTLKALAISLGLMFFQQLCGINAVIFYSTDIFKDAETGIDENLSTIVVGVMQVIATFVSVMVVDKLGRRLLLLASAIVMAFSTVAMGAYFYMKDNDNQSVTNLGWLPVSALCVFIIMFSIGFGPVPWLMMGELFASDVKGVAGSIAGTSNWVLAFIVTKTFVNMKEALGSGQTFWLFAGITVVGAIFVFLLVPETKGKSLNEIQKILEGNNNSSTPIVVNNSNYNSSNDNGNAN